MNSLCNCEELIEIKVEADMGSDPLWCMVCSYNLDIDQMEISDFLKEKLRSWINGYGSWINWDSDSLIDKGEDIEKKHNELGLELTEKVRCELNRRYKVVFSPSSMYQDINK